jgi:hypothetical protein
MKQKHLILILVFLLLMLLGVAACHAEPDTTALPPSLSSTTAPTNTATITQTSTKKPTRTPTLTRTITLTPSTTIDPRDFDASTIKTVTLSAPEVCPEIDPSIEIDVAELIKYRDEVKKSMPYAIDMPLFLELLNQGVSPEILITKLLDSEIHFSTTDDVRYADVTGDGVEDIILNMNDTINVFTCTSNRYRRIDIGRGGETGTVSFIDVLDINNDGLNDIPTMFNRFGSGYSTMNFHLFSWNGHNFDRLNPNACFTPGGYFTVSFEDVDNNGTKEIIQDHSGYTDLVLYDSLLPDRDTTHVCMWNGAEFLLEDIYHGDPVYRLQAYSDAIAKNAWGHPEEALALYLRVIHDENLKWVSPAENKQLHWQMIMEESAAKKPDIVYDPMYTWEIKRDIYEYPLLASASYYRMMLIYLQQDDIKNAETMVVILKDAYGPGKTGQHFTKMAEIVLEKYKETGDLEQSCPAAVEYATENWEDITSPLTYLRLGYFFNDPEHWCPYLPEGYGEE